MSYYSYNSVLFRALVIFIWLVDIPILECLLERVVNLLIVNNLLHVIAVLIKLVFFVQIVLAPC